MKFNLCQISRSFRIEVLPRFCRMTLLLLLLLPTFHILSEKKENYGRGSVPLSVRSRVWLLLRDSWEWSELVNRNCHGWNFIFESFLRASTNVPKVRKQGRLTATVLEFVSDVWSSSVSSFSSSRSSKPIHQRTSLVGFPNFVTIVVQPQPRANSCSFAKLLRPCAYLTKQLILFFSHAFFIFNFRIFHEI